MEDQTQKGMKLTIEVHALKPIDPATIFDIPPDKYDDVRDVIAEKLAQDIETSLNSHATLIWENVEFDISIKSE